MEGESGAPYSGNTAEAAKSFRGWFMGHFVPGEHPLFILLFPDREVCLAREGDFVVFGPGVPHSYRSVEESLVLTVRWPSRPAS